MGLINPVNIKTFFPKLEDSLIKLIGLRMGWVESVQVRSSKWGDLFFFILMEVKNENKMISNTLQQVNTLVKDGVTVHLHSYGIPKDTCANYPNVYSKPHLRDH